MSCTTILVGKKASNDGSTLIARNDDSPNGQFHVKKMALNLRAPKGYVSTISKANIPLPKGFLSYTSMPNVDESEGVWAAAGNNKARVSMTATETITSNPRVLSADPLVKTGIGEEDIVAIVLPYIKSAREGIVRLGELLEEFGTYESNGIAISDDEEIWWMETIGGHHYVAARVKDEEIVIMPNQFGLDRYDLKDKDNYICSADLVDFIRKNHLNLDNDFENGTFSPRLYFGSHSDSDHVYNTPRAWFMAKYLGDDSHKPTDDDIPWSIVPKHLIGLEDVKYLLSSHYQGTPYDSFGKDQRAGIYRPIGINRTSVLTVHQNKSGEPQVEWIAFGANPYNALVPVFTEVSALPDYYTNTTLSPSTEAFYWANRLIAPYADANHASTAPFIERYQERMMIEGRQAILAAIKKFKSRKDPKILEIANEKMADIAKTLTTNLLEKVLYIASCAMKCGYNRSDN